MKPYLLRPSGENLRSRLLGDAGLRAFLLSMKRRTKLSLNVGKQDPWSIYIYISLIVLKTYQARLKIRDGTMFWDFLLKNIKQLFFTFINFNII